MKRGRRGKGTMKGRKAEGCEEGEPWLRQGRAGGENEGLPPLYLDIFSCSSSGSCTKKAEASVGSQKGWVPTNPGHLVGEEASPPCWHLLNSVPVRCARMRKERDWPVPGRGRQSSVSSISRCLLGFGASGRGSCLWGRGSQNLCWGVSGSGGATPLTGPCVGVRGVRKGSGWGHGMGR